MNAALSVDSFRPDARSCRAVQSGIMIFIDTENIAGAVMNYLTPEKELGELRKSEKDNLRFRIRNKISFDTLVKEISTHRRRCPLCMVGAYAVALRPLPRPLTKAKLKLPPTNGQNKKQKEKPIDDNVLIRLFVEELTLLRYFKRACCRTFVLAAGDADYFDIVVCALKAGCNVEIWYTTNGLSSAYEKLADRYKCQTLCSGALVLVPLENHIPKIYPSCQFT